jgi:hypothetical protein
MRLLFLAFIIFLLSACGDSKKVEPNTTKPTVADNSVDKIINAYLDLKNAFFLNDSVAIGNTIAQLTIHTKIDTANLGNIQIADKVSLLLQTNMLAMHLDSLAKRKTVKDKLLLFKNMTDNIKAIGALSKTQNLYVQHCPMAEEYSADSKVYWVSNTEKIQNPFYPRKMPNCGVVVDTIVEVKK